MIRPRRCRGGCRATLDECTTRLIAGPDARPCCPGCRHRASTRAQSRSVDRVTGVPVEHAGRRHGFHVIPTAALHGDAGAARPSLLVIMLAVFATAWSLAGLWTGDVPQAGAGALAGVFLWSLLGLDHPAPRDGGQ